MKRQSFTMRRRAFLPGATVGLLAPLTARAQSAQSRTPVVGHLRVGSPGLLGDTDPLLEGLRALGYEDGKSLVIENRWAPGDVTRHPRLVRELIERSPAVIVSPCGDTLLTIREISRTVPVIVICADETNFVGEVASLARPGGYTTGVTFLSPESAGKRIELLREIVPRLSRLAVLYQPDDPLPSHWRELERLQSVFGFTCQRLPAVRPEELEAAFDDLTRERAQALFVFPTTDEGRGVVWSHAGATRRPMGLRAVFALAPRAWAVVVAAMVACCAAALPAFADPHQAYRAALAE